LRFILLDKVTELVRGERITAVKTLSLAEEYLADHFPTFPVMPGVLMVEALVQTAAMLVRVTQDFRHSMIVLEEARNVKYSSFVKPGMALTLEVEAKEIGEGRSIFKARGRVDGRSTVQARLTLRHYNLADENPALEPVDKKLIEDMKRRAELVGAA